MTRLQALRNEREEFKRQNPHVVFHGPDDGELVAVLEDVVNAIRFLALVTNAVHEGAADYLFIEKEEDIDPTS